jgi:Rha family phage regulatory protein
MTTTSPIDTDLIIGNSIPELVTKDLTTTSLALAKLFGKRHNDVLRTIRNAISDMSNETLTLRKIAQCSYVNEKNVIQPMFILGEEMTLVITGRLTGKNAFSVQMRLADAFIEMRNYMRNESARELEKFQSVIDCQSKELRLIEKREPRDEHTLAVIMGCPSASVRPIHDLLERNGYLTRTSFTQTYHNYSPTEKLGNICIGRKGSALLFDFKMKELVHLLLATESLFD